MKTWKLFISFLLVSAFVAIGTYSYMSRKGVNSSAFDEKADFSQNGFQLASYAEAAENTDFTFAAEQSVNAVVHIKSVVTPKQDRQERQQYINPFDFFFDNPFGGNSSPYRQQPRVGFGSGVIISEDGYIVTNNHVIESADEIEVNTNDERTFKAKLIGRDEATDIALLKIDGKDLHILPFGNSDNLKVGQWVLAVGNPLNLTSTVTAGIVSAIGRGDLGMGKSRGVTPSQQRVEAYIQTDAAVNPGNSGGALVNTRGELIGINAAIVTETGAYIGYSFAIPINMVKKVIGDLKKYGVVQRAMLGAMIMDISSVKKLSEIKESELSGADSETVADIKKAAEVYPKLKVSEGAYVKNFSTNSSAKKAGIQESDVITAINGVKVKTKTDLISRIMSSFSPGDKIDVEVNRFGEKKIFKVELKNNEGTVATLKHTSPAELLGSSFKELSREAKMRLGVNFGIEVTNVKAGKLKDAGIKNGFIILTANDDKISSENDLIHIVETLLKNAPDERGLFIKGLYPGERRVQYIAIDLAEY
ncbi:MAG: trypsin-like peptidase domain-containing protein [Dysgonamonadaceae bacterium]|jgi:S1-C subfamily serine protease|nr:trypsin-like peptidase domain-containing protein [Dysgonamonadaceae bacterium]